MPPIAAGSEPAGFYVQRQNRNCRTSSTHHSCSDYVVHLCGGTRYTKVVKWGSEMSGRFRLANQAEKLVLAAIRRVSSRKRIVLGTHLDDLDLSAAQRRSLYSAVRKAVSAANTKASLPAKAFAGVRTVGAIVDVVTRALRSARTGAEGRVDKTRPPIDLGDKVSRGPLRATAKKPTRKAAAKKSVAKKAVRKGAVKKTARKATAKKRPLKKAVGGRVTVKEWAVETPPYATAETGRACACSGCFGCFRSPWQPLPGEPVVGPPKPRPTAPVPIPKTERHISIWIAEGEKPFKRVLAIGQTYVLNFKVGDPVAGSLTTGPDATVPVWHIPIGGLATEWMVLAHGAELAAGTPDTTVAAETIGGAPTWTGRFSLLIPQAGDSAVPQLTIKPLQPNPHVDVVVIARGEVYRQFKIILTAASDPGTKRTEPSRVTDELMPTPTAHIGASTRHEWTTPASVLTVTVVGSQAVVHGDVGGTEVRSFEPWVGVQAQVNGPIKNVHGAAEELRAAWENHLDDINPDDLADRLQRWGKTGWGGPEYSWCALGDYADPAHLQQWERMAVSDELRKLAQHGWRLFRAFFPAGSNCTIGSRRFRPAPASTCRGRPWPRQASFRTCLGA
jgi:hypothetical protein